MKTLLALMLVIAMPLHAELQEVTVAEQYGLAMLPLMVMERLGLPEKYAAAAGVPGLHVNWLQVAGPSVMNDGLISGAVQFAAQGAPSLITLWNKTQRNVGVKAMAAITTYPLYLVTRNPAVRTLADFTDADRIALPSVKISTQAIMLQMGAARAFGAGAYQRLDPLTIGLSHPDAAAAFLSNTAGINTHFSAAPFYQQEIKVPGAHLVTTNYDILGGPATALVLSASGRFRTENPRVYRAFLDALAEATAKINADKPAAARLYLEMAHDRRNSEADILAIIEDPDYAYTMKPTKVLATAQFMAQVGTVKATPGALSDLFFPEAAALGGD